MLLSLAISSGTRWYNRYFFLISNWTHIGKLINFLLTPCNVTFSNYERRCVRQIVCIGVGWSKLLHSFCKKILPTPLIRQVVYSHCDLSKDPSWHFQHLRFVCNWLLIEKYTRSSPQWWSSRSTTLHDVLNLWSPIYDHSVWGYLGIEMSSFCSPPMYSY